jgi:hypothetical protein
MKRFFVLALFSSVAAWAADPTPLNLRPGQWEYSVTMQMPGMPQASQIPQIPPEQLAKLPPEQRAKVEAAMKQAANMAGGKPIVSKNCVKKEDLANFNPGAMSKSCKITRTSSTPTRFEAKVDCDDPNMKSSGTVVVEALSPESMKFSLVSKGTSNGQPANMSVNGTGKWLADACTDSK